MKKLLLVAVLFALVSCTDEDASHKALRSQGFTNISFTGYEHFSCSEDDVYKTGFVATNPNGQRVEGTVCCGFFKSCTVRW